MEKREQHIVKGQVQGVGFRPFVYKIAMENNLCGFVQNTPKGVSIEIQGSEENIRQFNLDFQLKLPPLARISSHEKTEIPLKNDSSFAIIHSEQGEHKGHSVLVSPDVAVCGDCKNDMFDPKNRRYGYAFTNCTSCGPRYTITKSIPYDRPVTSMGCFPLCPDCHEEYTNPLDRRFHAQPNACAVCGPHIWLSDGKKLSAEQAAKKANPPYFPQNQNILAADKEALTECINLLNQGKIVAIKGLGGFQLACNAFDEDAIHELRKRKNRPHKAFALMVKDLESAKELAYVNKEAEKLLTSISAPIVLCPAKNGLPGVIAPDTHRIGIMLAYTPLHLLLFSPSVLQKKTNLQAPKALIMTSANQGGKPICIKNRQALQDLQGIADYYLFHDRDILIRVDDSVCLALSDNTPHAPEHTEKTDNFPANRTNFDGSAYSFQSGLRSFRSETPENQLPKTVYFRRARGFVPSPVSFPEKESYLSSVFAAGAFLKNTFCFTKEKEACPSQHIGDMDNLEVLDFFEETAKHLQKLLEVKPQKALADLHPDFPSTRMAEEYCQWHGITLEKVQHHIAHAYSVLAEQKQLLNTPYFALIMDGTGLGYDNSIWGGEIFYLFAREKRHYRLASLTPIALIGGDKANFEPWRIAYAFHKKAQEKEYLQKTDSFPFEQDPEFAASLARCSLMLEKNINCPKSSGCGRLFDAVSALLNICTHTSYEGQAAIKLEDTAFSSNTDEYVDIPLHKNPAAVQKIRQAIQKKQQLDDFTACVEIDTVFLYAQVFKLSRSQRSAADIARIFHNSLARALAACLSLLHEDFPSEQLIVSGGVFNNEILIKNLYREINGLSDCGTAVCPCGHDGHDSRTEKTQSEQSTKKTAAHTPQGPSPVMPTSRTAPKLQILFPQNTPVGDACISLGQAFYGALQPK